MLAIKKLKNGEFSTDNGDSDTPNEDFIATNLDTNEGFKIFYGDNGDIYWSSTSNEKKASIDTKSE